MKTTLEYCARAIVRYLGGDIEQFVKHRDKAMEIYIRENIVTIGELVSAETKVKLYEMVS
jgi:hypothetical protein